MLKPRPFIRVFQHSGCFPESVGSVFFKFCIYFQERFDGFLSILKAINQFFFLLLFPLKALPPHICVVDIAFQNMKRSYCSLKFHFSKPKDLEFGSRLPLFVRCAEVFASINFHRCFERIK